MGGNESSAHECFIERQNRSQAISLNLQIKHLEKEEQTKSKVSRR